MHEGDGSAPVSKPVLRVLHESHDPPRFGRCCRVRAQEDLEEPVIEREKDDLRGGTVRLANGWLLGLPKWLR